MKSSHSHLELPFKNQWYFPGTWATNRFLFFPLKEYPHCLLPHWLQSAHNLELSSFILRNEPHAFGLASVWPLKYCTTASPLLLAAVVKWRVRPLFLLQWNLNWVKDKCVLSFFIASVLRNNDLFWQFHGMMTQMNTIARMACRRQRWRPEANLLEKRNEMKWNSSLGKIILHCIYYRRTICAEVKKTPWSLLVFLKHQFLTSSGCHITVDL